MSPLDFPLLTDENIHPKVISFLKQNGYDVKSIYDFNLQGQIDAKILQLSFENNRVVLTHDSDFGKLTVVEEKPFIGIIYLRPGHIKAEFTIENLKAINKQSINVNKKFIIISERAKDSIKIRVRQL